MTAARHVATRTGRWLVRALLLALVALLLVTVVVPRLAGAAPYTVLTGSMRPDLPPGTFIAVRPVDPAEVGVGSVITYQRESGRPEVVTHRVVSQAVAADGTPLFRTRGDANGAADPGWVRPVQLRGEVWYSVPHVGRVSALLTEDRRDLVVRGLALGLLAYGVVMLLSGPLARARHRGGRTMAVPATRVRHG